MPNVTAWRLERTNALRATIGRISERSLVASPGPPCSASTGSRLAESVPSTTVAQARATARADWIDWVGGSLAVAGAIVNLWSRRTGSAQAGHTACGSRVDCEQIVQRMAKFKTNVSQFFVDEITSATSTCGNRIRPASCHMGAVFQQPANSARDRLQSGAPSTQFAFNREFFAICLDGQGRGRCPSFPFICARLANQLRSVVPAKNPQCDGKRDYGPQGHDRDFWS